MLAALLITMALAAAPPTYHPPRTPQGRPDLQGEWTNDSLTSLERDDYFDTLVPTEAKVAEYERIFNDPQLAAAYSAARRKKSGRPAPPNVGQQESEWFDYIHIARVGGQPRSAFLTDPASGELPYTKAAVGVTPAYFKRMARVFDNPEDRGSYERCLITTAGGPPLGNAGTNANYTIVQTKDDVAIVSETEHDVRTIRIDATHGGVAEWMGDSTAAWQGDTLRVETVGFPAAYSLGVGLEFLLSPRAKVTEWFTRVAEDEINYRFQVDDPELYTRPWRGEMALRPGKGVREYACHEGNYALRGVLAGAREWERQGRPLEFLDGGDPPPKSETKAAQ